jgi:hypothetical protein
MSSSLQKMVSGGRKGAGEEPALSFDKKFPWFFLSASFLSPCWMDGCYALSSQILFFAGV